MAFTFTEKRIAAKLGVTAQGLRHLLRLAAGKSPGGMATHALIKRGLAVLRYTPDPQLPEYNRVFYELTDEGRAAVAQARREGA